MLCLYTEIVEQRLNIVVNTFAAHEADERARREAAARPDPEQRLIMDPASRHAPIQRHDDLHRGKLRKGFDLLRPEDETAHVIHRRFRGDSIAVRLHETDLPKAGGGLVCNELAVKSIGLGPVE